MGYRATRDSAHPWYSRRGAGQGHPTPGACHLYIHSTESTTQPNKAEACADFLGGSIPGASHINHMPSHTYNQVGRWGDGVRANQRAWHSDQAAEYGEGFAIYTSHNLHMLLFAASNDGQGAVAIQAGADYTTATGGAQYYEVLARVRFGRFEDILAMEGDDTENPIFKAFWDFGQGYAHLRAGHVDVARGFLEAIEEGRGSAPESAQFRGHSASDLLGIVGGILGGEISREEGNTDEAIASFERAVEIEDGLRYDEPEPLPFAVRDWLGAILLEVDRPGRGGGRLSLRLSETIPSTGGPSSGSSRRYAHRGKSERPRRLRRFSRPHGHGRTSGFALRVSKR